MINGKLAVHCRAPAKSASGYGVHARQVVDYLLSDDRFIVFLEDIQWGHTPSVHEWDFEDKEKLHRYYSAMANYEQAQAQNIQYDISVQVTIPNEFVRRAQINIGVHAGIEVDRCTYEWIKKCNEMDLIVVPSTFSAKVMSETVYDIKNNTTGEQSQERLRVPLHVIPEWFEKPTNPLPDLKVKFSTKKNLLFVGLWGNKGGFGEDRKNISNLIRMFLTHFGDNPEYGLILKTSIINNSTEDLHHTKQKIAQIKANFKNVKAKIYLIHEHLSDAEMWSLYNHPDVLGMVSLTLGEGFNLPALEASAAGLPVLATNWSGHLDFLREKHGFIPIDYDMKEVPDCQVWKGVIDKGARWACPDEEDVKKRLKKFLENPSIIRKAAKENIAWMEQNFEKKAVISKWQDFFNTFIKPVGATSGISQTEVSDPRVLQEVAHRDQVLSAARDLEAKLNLPERVEDKSRVVYVMPRSFGDVVISTSIVHSLIANRHSNDDFYFATSPEYREVLEGLVQTFSNFKIIDFDERLMNNEVSREIFDCVYNPTVNVQYTFSNWTLGNGEFGVRLLEEFAKHCNISPNEVVPYVLAPKKCAIPNKQYVSLTAVSSKQAKHYKHWEDIVYNLKNMADVEVVQSGMKSEELVEGCLDYRGLTFNETMYVVSRSILHLSPDTGTAHVAGALGVPHIVLFGTTSPYQCCPLLFSKKINQIIIDSAASKEPRSYRDIDINVVDGLNTISQISPETVCKQAFEILNGIKTGSTFLPVLRLNKTEVNEKVGEWYANGSDVAVEEYLGLTKNQYTRFIEEQCEDL